MAMSRRGFLASSAVAGAGAAVVSVTGGPDAAADTPNSLIGAGSRGGGANSSRRPPRPGPLRNDPRRLLALPAGFSYKLVAQSGVTELERGGKTPERTDGTGAFAAGNRIRLVQNHEIGPKYGSKFPVPITRGTVYDAGITVGGGCTVVEVSRQGDRIREWVALSGTISNCAGGITPWGSWLSCEETEDRKGTKYGAQTLQQDHGFVFEVLPEDATRQHPAPIRAWGRFSHEAVVVQPGASQVFLTEDASGPNGLFYRWSTPPGLRLARGMLTALGAHSGRLAAMKVTAPDGGHLDDLSRITSQYVGTELSVSWVTVPDRTAEKTSVRSQFTNDQITRSKKIEGAWGARDGVWFAASFAHQGDVPNGSVFHDGQLWFYDYRRETLTLKLYLPYVEAIHAGKEPLEMRGDGVTYFDGPDNVHVSPFGGIVFAEDGDGDQHLVGFTPAGGTFPLARNELRGNADDEVSSFSEMTGPTFSPDGRILFANIQEPGHTFAITGPFAHYLST